MWFITNIYEKWYWKWIWWGRRRFDSSWTWWLFKRLSVSLGLKVQKAADLADISVLFSQLFFWVKFVSVLFKSRFASLTDQHVLNCCQLPHHPIPCVENGPAIFDHINLILGFNGIVFLILLWNIFECPSKTDVKKAQTFPTCLLMNQQRNFVHSSDLALQKARPLSFYFVKPL